jgi:hypothetical protein
MAQGGTLRGHRPILLLGLCLLALAGPAAAGSFPGIRLPAPEDSLPTEEDDRSATPVMDTFGEDTGPDRTEQPMAGIGAIPRFDRAMPLAAYQRAFRIHSEWFGRRTRGRTRPRPPEPARPSAGTRTGPWECD